ncbi:hypothetical protein V6615_10250 [Oscillospiraceae bacterium PP1C4]
MKFSAPLLVVKDISTSRAFYEKLLDQTVVMDFGENITFDGGFSLQEQTSWLDFIDKTEDVLKTQANNMELYFDAEAFPTFVEKLKSNPEIQLVHDVKEYSWGQRSIRFYDPDFHIIEVGESIENVIRRFLKQGLTIEETAARTQLPMEFIQQCAESVISGS